MLHTISQRTLLAVLFALAIPQLVFSQIDKYGFGDESSGAQFHAQANEQLFPAPNPDMVIGPCEELDIIVVLDESGSIDDDSFFPGHFSQNEQEVRAALFGLASVLQNSGTDMAIIEFSTLSEIIDLDGSGPGLPGYRPVDDDFMADLSEYLYPGGVNPPANDSSGYEAFGFTNWEAAFDDIISLNAIQQSDLVVFMTDGNPTAYLYNDGSVCADCPEGTSLAEAVAKADIVRNSGSHLYGVAVGESINLSNIIQITGPEEDLVSGDADGLTPANADFTQATFSDIQSDFNLIATEACEPDAVMEKSVYLGHDAGLSAPGVESVSGYAGTPVTYIFEFTNLGNTYLDMVDFSDDSLGVNLGSPELQILSGQLPIPPLSAAPSNTLTLYIESSIEGDLVNRAFAQFNPVDSLGEDLGLADLLVTDTAAVIEEGLPCGACSLDAPVAPVCPMGTFTVYASVEGLCENPQRVWQVDEELEILANYQDSIVLQAPTVCSAEYTVGSYVLCEGCAQDTIACEAVAITVLDTEAPVILCPSDLTLSCMDSTDPLLTGNATAFDGCSSVTIDFSDQFISSCGSAGTLTRTWWATDACGNSSSCQQLISIVDDNAPELSCPADITISCDVAPHPDVTGYATVLDDCAQVSLSYEDSIMSLCGGSQQITRVWIAVDQCGNSTACVQSIQLLDQEAPSIFCPDNQILSCGADTSIHVLGIPVVVDNCSSVSISYSDSIQSPCEGSTLILRQWSATDACGNSSSCVQQIALLDTEAPLLDCPADTLVACGTDLSPDNLGWALAEDDCSSISISYTDTMESTCGQAGFLSRYWSVSDACGNTSTCVQTIEIVDLHAPVLLGLPSDTVAYCTADTGLDEVTAIDHCDGEVPVQYDEFISYGECPVIIRTWTSADACGNSVQASRSIQLIDTVAPVIGELEAFIEVACDSLDLLPLPVTDDCDVNLDIDYSDVLFSGDCGVVERSWSVSDDCGNISYATQYIMLVDEVAPVFYAAPQDTVISCIDDLVDAMSPEAIDNCADEVSITFNEVIDQDGSLVTRTWIASDNCGNSAVYEQLINIDGQCEDCDEFDTAPVGLTKSYQAVNGVMDRLQLKWYKASPAIKYSDEDAAACDIQFWERRDLDPQSGDPIGPVIEDAPVIELTDVKKFYPDDSPRSIFKWPVKYFKAGENNAKRVLPNKRYQWRVRCACEHGEGPESPWSQVRTFNTPDFDMNTGVYSDEEAEKLRTVEQNDDRVFIYPNPTSSKVFISADVEFSSYEVRDVQGKILFQEGLSKKGGAIDVSELEPGMYTMLLIAEGRLESHVLIVH